MARAQFADNWVSTLSASYTSGGTSLSVTDATLLPSSGDYYVLVQAEGVNGSEVFKVTSRASNVLTVVGAQANTSAANHASGATVQGAILTSGAITQLRTDLISSLTAAAFDTATSSGTVQGGYNLVYINDGPYQALWNGSAWEYFIADVGKVVRPVLSAFTAVNGTGATATASGGGINVKSNAPGNLVENYQLWVASTPTAPYTVTVIADVAFNGIDYAQFGAVLRESSTGKFVGTSYLNSSTNGLCKRFGKYNSATAINSDYLLDTDGANWRMARWEPMRVSLRFVVDATNISAYWSLDGLVWEQTDTARSKTDFLAGGPNQFGFYISGGSRSTYARVLQCAAV